MLPRLGMGNGCVAVLISACLYSATSMSGYPIFALGPSRNAEGEFGAKGVGVILCLGGGSLVFGPQ